MITINDLVNPGDYNNAAVGYNVGIGLIAVAQAINNLCVLLTHESDPEQRKTTLSQIICGE